MILIRMFKGHRTSRCATRLLIPKAIWKMWFPWKSPSFPLRHMFFLTARNLLIKPSTRRAIYRVTRSVWYHLFPAVISLSPMQRCLLIRLPRCNFIINSWIAHDKKPIVFILRFIIFVTLMQGTLQLSYQQVWIEKQKPFMPRGRIKLVTAKMQSETTSRCEYVAKTTLRPDLIVPSDNIRIVDVPLEGDTITKLSYVKPDVIKPVRSCKPVIQCYRWGDTRNVYVKSVTLTTKMLGCFIFQYLYIKNFIWLISISICIYVYIVYMFISICIYVYW